MRPAAQPQVVRLHQDGEQTLTLDATHPGTRLALIGLTLISGIYVVYWAAFAMRFVSGQSVLAAVQGWLVVGMFTWWVKEDSRETHYWPAFHYAWLLMFLWPVAIPHYLVHTRGWRGLRIFPMFVGASLVQQWGYGLGLLTGVVLRKYDPHDALRAWLALWGVRACERTG